MWKYLQNIQILLLSFLLSFSTMWKNLCHHQNQLCTHNSIQFDEPQKPLLYMTVHMNVQVSPKSDQYPSRSIWVTESLKCGKISDGDCIKFQLFSVFCMLPILCMYFVNYTLISSVMDHLHIKLGTLTSSIFLVNASEVCCISVAVSCRVYPEPYKMLIFGDFNELKEQRRNNFQETIFYV